MAKFSEIFRCSGVDDNPNIPGKSAAEGLIALQTAIADRSV
jgi:hypothetical protein